MWALIALSSAVFFAIKDILAKRMFNKKNVKPLQILFEQYFLILVISLTLLYPNIDFSSYKELWILYLAKSLVAACATVFYLEMLKRYDISHVSPLLNLSPLVLLFFAVVFLSEKISLIQFGGIILILASTYYLEVIVHHHKKDKPHKFQLNVLKKAKSSFFILAILTLVTISLAAVFDKLILKEVNVYTNLFFNAVIILFVLSIYYIREGYFLNALKDIKREPETLVISVFTVISLYLVLVAIAIPSALVSLIIPLRRTSTLMSSIFGGILFHEKHLKQKFITTIGMLVGVIFIVI